MSGLENIGSAKLITGTATKISGGDLVLQQGAISRVSPSLQSLPQTTTLRGEVISQDPNGVTRIQTPRGEVELRLDKPIAQGQKVDIQLSSGAPPREAIIQTRPETSRLQTSVQPQQSAQPNVQPTSTAPTTPNTSYQSVDALRQTIQQVNTTANTTAQTGQTIRTAPLPPFLQNSTGVTTLNTQPSLPLAGQGHMSPILTPGSFTLKINTLSSAQNMTTPTSTLGILQSHQVKGALPPFINGAGKTTPSHMATTKSGTSVSNVTTSHTGSLSTLNSLFTSMNHPSNTMQITAIKTPSAMMGGQQASLITQPIQAGQINATVTGFTAPNGFPILQTTSTINNAPVFFTLQTKTPLPAGTQITLSPTSTGLPRSPQPMQWSAFQDGLDFLLQNIGNTTQAHNLLGALPRPEISARQFTATALLFFAAARGGDISQFMGNFADQTFRSIPQGRNIASKLLDDIRQSTGKLASSDPSAPTSIAGSSEWRGTTLPLLFGLEVHKINLWTKDTHDNGEDDDSLSANQESNKRFIVDVTLSRMGNVQLDGFAQPSLKRLDLILKTQQNFTKPVQSHLQTLWLNAMHQVDMTGTLEFETI